MQVLYAGLTEGEMAKIISHQKMNCEALERGVIFCRESCTGDEALHVLEALSDALIRVRDEERYCYVVEVCVNEGQILQEDEIKINLEIPVDGVPGVQLGSIINVYSFDLSYKLRIAGAILGSQRGCSELLDRFGINYLTDDYSAFLEWFWRLNVKPPVLGAKFFSANNIPVAGKTVVPLHEIKEAIQRYADAVKQYSKNNPNPGGVLGTLHVTGVGCVEINLDYFLETASPLMLAEVLSGNSRAIVEHLETVNPICAIASIAERLLNSVMSTEQFGLVVEFDRAEVEAALLKNDPEKYSLLLEVLKKREFIN